MHILIFGTGQFAHWFTETFPAHGHTIQLASGVDIRDRTAVREAVRAHQPDVLINTAAKTNLDWCEQHQLECFDTNVRGADTVAAVAAETHTYLIHISTGCIQESTSEAEAHPEDDPANPTSFYSWTKYWADELLMSRMARSGSPVLILRPRQPMSGKASNRNALVKMLTFTQFIDTPNSITILEDFMEAARLLMEQGATGIYNVANPGVTSPYRIALLLQALVDPTLTVNKISKDELNAVTLAQRIDSVLDCSKLARAGIKLRPAADRLRELLPELRRDLEQHPDIFALTKRETEHKLHLRAQQHQTI